MSDSPVAKRRGRPPATDSQDTKERILAAARQCFARLGYIEATNKQIAEAAGVTASALYNHFPAKPQLYFAVLEVAEAEISEAIEAAVNKDDPILVQLKDILRVFAELHQTDPSRAAFMAGISLESMRNPDIASLLENPPMSIYNQFRELILGGRARGEIDTSIPADRLVDTLLALTTGLSWSGLRSTPAEHQEVLLTFGKMLDGSLFSHH